MADEKPEPGKGEAGKPKEPEGGWKIPEAERSSEKKWGEKDLGSAGNRKPEAGEGENKPGWQRQASLGPVYKKELTKGEVWRTPKKGEGDDKTFVQVLRGEIQAEALKASYDLDKKVAKLTVVDVKAEGSIVHAQVDLVDKIKHLIFGGSDGSPPASPGAPMAARVADVTMHLGPLAPGPGSSNVFIGGMPAWRAGLDVHVCPAPGAVPHGPGVALPGAATVLINGAPAARATDFVVEPMGGPDVIAIGCPTVLIGQPTLGGGGQGKGEDKSEPWVIFESVASGDVGKGEGTVGVVAEADLAKRKGKIEAVAGAEVAALKGELPLKVRIRIPFTSYYLGLGVKGEGSLLGLGAEAGAGVKINDGKKLFDATAGAKVTAGLAGVGIKFGVDISKK